MYREGLAISVIDTKLLLSGGKTLLSLPIKKSMACFTIEGFGATVLK
jgi:hypothetical protein